MPSSWATILGLSWPAEIDGFLPKQEGAYADGLNASDWISTGLEAALDSKEDSQRGRAKQEIEESFSHSPPHLPHWQQVNALDSNDFDLKLEQETMLATQGLTTKLSLQAKAHCDGSI